MEMERAILFMVVFTVMKEMCGILPRLIHGDGAVRVCLDLSVFFFLFLSGECCLWMRCCGVAVAMQRPECGGTVAVVDLGAGRIPTRVLLIIYYRPSYAM